MWDTWPIVLCLTDIVPRSQMSAPSVAVLLITTLERMVRFPCVSLKMPPPLVGKPFGVREVAGHIAAAERHRALVEDPGTLVIGAEGTTHRSPVWDVVTGHGAAAEGQRAKVEEAAAVTIVVVGVRAG